MTSDFDDQLRALFENAERELPAEAFTAGVTARLRAHRRRIRLLQGFCVMTTVVVLWLLAPDIDRGAVAVARFPDVMIDLAGRSVRALSESSLLCVVFLYSGVFGSYLLLKMLRQFHIR